MGVGRIFSRERPKVVKFVFHLSKLKKQPFYANNFKIQGGKGPPAPTSDAHAEEVNLLYICNKLTFRHKNGVYLYSSKFLKVLLKIQ